MGIMILPFLAYGFYRVFSQDVHEESYKRSWIPLTVGFTLLIQSHLLTGEMAGFFTVLLCIVMIKRVFRKETFLVLAKTVVYSVLLSAWFLVPFGDYMLTGDFVIHNVSARTIQNRGLYQAHLLFAFFRAGTNVFFEEGGMAYTQPMGVGIALLAGLLIWCFLRFNGKTEILEKREAALGRICAAFGTAAMVMSLSLFPWDKIQGLGGIAQTLVSSIQFPKRFLTIANVCLTVLAGLVAKYVLVNGKRIQYLLYVAGMLSLMVISSIFLTNDYLNSLSLIRAYNSEAIGTSYIAGAEYLPLGVSREHMSYHDPVSDEGTVITEYEKKGLKASLFVRTTQEGEHYVELPMLYYKGYHGKNTDTGEALQTVKGDNGDVRVILPKNFAGRISCSYDGMWYWHLATAVSIIACCGIAALGAVSRRKEKRR